MACAIDGEVPPAEHAALVARILAAYQQIIDRAHAHGLRVIGATITPYVGSAYYHPGPAERSRPSGRQPWIRAPGHFDAVLDFDKVVRDPAPPRPAAPRLRLRRPPPSLSRRIQGHGRLHPPVRLHPVNMSCQNRH